MVRSQKKKGKIENGRPVPDMPQNNRDTGFYRLPAVLVEIFFRGLEKRDHSILLQSQPSFHRSPFYSPTTTQPHSWRKRGGEMPSGVLGSKSLGGLLHGWCASVFCLPHFFFWQQTYEGIMYKTSWLMVGACCRARARKREATRTQVPPLDPHFDGCVGESVPLAPPRVGRGIPPVLVDRAP